jgi:hypothetical protein
MSGKVSDGLPHPSAGKAKQVNPVPGKVDPEKREVRGSPNQDTAMELEDLLCTLWGGMAHDSQRGVDNLVPSGKQGKERVVFFAPVHEASST